jgi:hypothetical protein
MLRALLVRALNPGITDEQLRNVWRPGGVHDRYPTTARVARRLSDDRQVITIMSLTCRLRGSRPPPLRSRALTRFSG